MTAETAISDFFFLLDAELERLSVLILGSVCDIFRRCWQICWVFFGYIHTYLNITNKRPQTKRDAEKELFKTSDQVSKSLVTESEHRSEGNDSTDDEDRNYCLSLVARLRRLDDKMKAHAHFQIEKIFHDIEYNSDGTNSAPNSAAMFGHGSTNTYSPYYGVTCMERPFPQ